MGYELHITRKPEPDGDDYDGGISLSEWKSYVDGDSTLCTVERAETYSPDGETLWVSGPGMTVWTGHPTANEPGNFAWLHHANGEITVKHPDQEFLAKMLAIAKDLNAAIVGDDGEEYTTPDAHGILPSVVKDASRNLKPWWRFW